MFRATRPVNPAVDGIQALRAGRTPYRPRPKLIGDSSSGFTTGGRLLRVLAQTSAPQSITARKVEPVRPPSYEWVERTLDNVGRLSPRQMFERVKDEFDAVVAALSSENEEVRYVAPTILSMMGDSRAVEHLIENLETGFMEGVRPFSIPEALVAFGDHRAVPALHALITDPRCTDEARGKSIDALGEFGDPAVSETLLMMSLKEDDAHIRMDAIGAVVKIGLEHVPHAEAFLLGHINDPESPYRVRAARAMLEVLPKDETEGVWSLMEWGSDMDDDD